MSRWIKHYDPPAVGLMGSQVCATLLRMLAERAQFVFLASQVEMNDGSSRPHGTTIRRDALGHEAVASSCYSCGTVCDPIDIAPRSRA